MAGIFKRFRCLLFGDKGQGMVEYGLIIGLVAVILLGALFMFGNSLADYFMDIASALP